MAHVSAILILMLSYTIMAWMLLCSVSFCMTKLPKVMYIFRVLSSTKSACASFSLASEIFLGISCQRKRLLHNLEAVGKCFFLAD